MEHSTGQRPELGLGEEEQTMVIQGGQNQETPPGQGQEAPQECLHPKAPQSWERQAM